VVAAVGANAAAVAEQAMALLLACAKSVVKLNERMHQGHWDKATHKSVELAGRTVGVVGLGAIGRRFARMADAMDMRGVLDTYGSDEAVKRAVAAGIDVTLVVPSQWPEGDSESTVSDENLPLIELSVRRPGDVNRHTYVDTKDEQTDFVQDLRKALIGSNVNVIRTKGSSGATISVHSDALDERIHSVSARNIPTEYELTYKVEFSVTSAGKTLIDHEEISATRDISFDETQLLAKEREQEILREALARDLVALVMRRLAAL